MSIYAIMTRTITGMVEKVEKVSTAYIPMKIKEMTKRLLLRKVV